MSKQAGVRVAIITGARSGIGQSAAIRIAERGAGGGIRVRDVF
jgi:NADP-dependent 3-hydroxy acid dehydrogenase YdfG